MSSLKNKFTPVIIIGAPRSGTNMLRDILTNFEGIETWPCDEINYIWRHGNIFYPSDEIPANLATKSVKKLIQSSFKSLSKKNNPKIILEKTCANSLRVPFVDTVIPDAKYIFIIRNGLDCVCSAKTKWNKKPNIYYILNKLRFVPYQDFPLHIILRIWNFFLKIFKKNRKLGIWGPNFDGMSKMLYQHNLNKVCAIQWERCVNLSEEAFSNMPVNKYINVRYEDFIYNPEKNLKMIIDFIGYETSAKKIQDSIKNVHSKSIGRSNKEFHPEELIYLKDLLKNTLKKYGYS
jgi:hypothetical protein